MPKKEVYEVIDRNDGGEEVYALLDETIAKLLPELAGMRIVLCWRIGWKPNKDGHLTLGKASLVNELDEKLMSHDGKILLNVEAWHKLTDHQRRALMHHECRHFAQAVDLKTEEQAQDESGRCLWRLKGHDLEEHNETYRLFGPWRKNIETLLNEREETQLSLLTTEGTDDGRKQRTLGSGRGAGDDATRGGAAIS